MHFIQRGLFLFIFLAVILVSACISSEKTTEEENIQMNASVTPLQECFATCKAINRSLETGPCLLDPVPSNPMWVCDIAHTPRITVDSRPENQCQSYRNESATHFIELTPECEMIRIV